MLVVECRVPEECPPEIAALVQECLHIDPWMRPTASQIITRIEASYAPSAYEISSEAAWTHQLKAEIR